MKSTSEGGIIDRSPEEEAPYRTDDARGSSAEVHLVGGFLLQPAPGSTELEAKLLNIAIMREMTGYEEDMLTDKKTDLSRRLQGVLAACLTRIGDGAGTWLTDPKKMMGVVDGLTAGDRTQLLFYLRRISVPDGDEYAFRVNCKNCGNEIRHTVNIAELEVTHMPNPLERIYDVMLPSGITARCRVMLGRDEQLIDKAQKEGRNVLSASLLARVTEINGQPVKGYNGLKRLAVKDRECLRREFDKREGGVETDTMIRCNSCGSKYEVSIDIGQTGFFFPSAERRI